jgi:uncharacterized protein (DUF427 family)
MPERFNIRPAEGVWVVRAGGAVLGETARALELTEPDGQPMIYFPLEDVAMAFLDTSEDRSDCLYRGPTQHYHIIAKSGPIRNAAQSYPEPREGFERIRGHIAFLPALVTLERV